MIRVILKGGLGNQMFQYALGKTLSLKHDVPLYLDLSFLKYRIPLKGLTPLRDFTYRDYDLDIFDVKDEVGTKFNNDFLDKHISYPITVFINKFRNEQYIREKGDIYKYKSEILEAGPDLVLEGYWQNYKYFKQFEKEIRDIFDTEKLYSKNFKETEEAIKNTRDSVSIHIRKGDFLNKKHKNVYNELSLDYYSKAIELINSKFDKPHYFIFGEEEEEKIGAKIPLKKIKYKVIRNNTSGYKDSSHFRFMSICRHNIISNSTYSWWAAYLNKTEEKLVVTPTKWMKKYEFDNLPDWIQLKV